MAIHASDIDLTPPDYEETSPDLIRYLHENFAKVASILDILENGLQGVSGGILIRTPSLSQPLDTTFQKLVTYDDVTLTLTPGIDADFANGRLTLQEGYSGYYVAFFTIFANGANNTDYTYQIYVDGTPLPLAIGSATSTSQAQVSASVSLTGFVPAGSFLEVFAKVDSGSNVQHDVLSCALGIQRTGINIFNAPDPSVFRLL